MNPFVITLLLLALVAVSGYIGYRLGYDHAGLVAASKLQAGLGVDGLHDLMSKLDSLNKVNTTTGDDSNERD